MIKYGIKLWTANKNWFKEAVDLFNKKQISFIELYIITDSFKIDELEILKNAEISLHAPHFSHNFNIFDLDEYKIYLFKNQIIKTANFLNSKYIILHAGIGEEQKIFEKNINKVYDERIIIENMPKIGLNNKICFGYSLKQLEFIKNERGLNICLDINHAIKSAVSQKIDYKKFLELLLKKLNPNYFHISDGNLNNEKDEHLNLREGNFDLKLIKNVLEKISIKKDINLVFEVPKIGNDLKNDLKNIKYFKNL